jgi:hypothetical protein
MISAEVSAARSSPSAMLSGVAKEATRLNDASWARALPAASARTEDRQVNLVTRGSAGTRYLCHGALA